MTPKFVKLTEAWIRRMYGKKCSDYGKKCPICEVWKAWEKFKWRWVDDRVVPLLPKTTKPRLKESLICDKCGEKIQYYPYVFSGKRNYHDTKKCNKIWYFKRT